MKQFYGLASMLLVSSAGAMQSGDVALHGHDNARDPSSQISTRYKPAPKLSVKIIPSKVKINDTSEKRDGIATVAVTWSNKAPYTGIVTLPRIPTGSVS